MGTTEDVDIARWDKDNGFVVVTRDSDYVTHARRPLGCKVIWVRIGNCRTAVIHDLLRREAIRIQKFGDNAIETLLFLR